MRMALVGAEFEENLAIRYLWGALEQAGHEVRQVVFNGRADLERAARKLADSEAALAGFSMVFTYRAREFADLARRCRELGFGGHLVAGGHFAAFNAEALLRDVPAFDSVAIGEGEEILCDLAGALADSVGSPAFRRSSIAPQDRLKAGLQTNSELVASPPMHSHLAAVRGLVWRNAAGEIVRNEPAVKPPHLDKLPYPKRKSPPDTYLGIPVVNLLSSRGCTHACAFCSIAAWHKLCGGARFRMRSPESVAEEMAQLFEQGARIFNFHDDNFFLGSQAASLERVQALECELGRRGVGRIAFAVKARPDSVDQELFAHLKSMGLFRVFLGVEAGTAESLHRLGRGQTRGDNERALAVVNALDIHCCFNLLMLNPNSTLEDFAANVAFLRQHPHNPMNFCRTEVYAGTPLEARLRRDGRLRGSYWGYDYEIADPRAQQLFDLVYPAFLTRNYGDEGVHHRAMSVDYEYQLLAHFFGGSDRLRGQVKDYIAAVNLNTCEHLERIVAAVASGLAGDAEADFLRETTDRVHADNRRLLDRGQELLDRIRRSARRRRAGSDHWLQKVVAAGVAASLTLATARCERQESETAPRPAKAPPSGTREFETLPWKGPELPPGDPALVKSSIRRSVEVLAGRIAPPRDMQVEVWIDEKGEVARFLVWGAQLSNGDRKVLGEALRMLKFYDPDIVGKRFLVPIPKSALEPRAVPGTHFHEEAPAPDEQREGGPRTHNREMAPAPPSPEK